MPRFLPFVAVFIICFILMLLFKMETDDAPATNDAIEFTEITEDFWVFYERFHQDSLFQMEHIAFPLQGKSELENWLHSEWTMHRPYDDMNGSFKREFISFEGLVIEKIKDYTGSYGMERRYSKSNNGWNLIYYEPMKELGKKATQTPPSS